MKTSFNTSNNMAAMPQQSHVIEHQLRDNPIYARTTTTNTTTNNNTTHQEPPCPISQHNHHHHHQQQQHSYEKLDHVIVNPAPNHAPYNLLTTPTAAAATSPPDVVNTMAGTYLVAASRDQQQQLAHRPIIILAPPTRSRDAAAELNVVTDQHGRQCCCTSASGLPSTATSGGGGYMECDNAMRTMTRNNLHVIAGGDESRERLGAEPGRHDTCWLARDQNAANHNRSCRGAYTTMSHMNRQLNDWNISAL